MQRDGLWKSVFRLRKDEEVALQLDHVLLHLRHKALRAHSSSDQTKMTLLSIPFVWLIEIVTLPMLFIGKFKSLLISLIISAISLIILPDFESANFIFLTLLLWSLLNIKAVCEKVFELLFDLLDLVFLGKLTKKLTDFYSSLSIQEQRAFKTNWNGKFIQHLYTSRQGYGAANERYQLWESYFVALFRLCSKDKQLLNLEIDRYWLEANQPNSFYEKFDPIMFSEHLDWIQNDEWSSATPAIVEFVLRKQDDINQTRTGFGPGGLHGPRTLLGTAVAAGAPLELIKIIIEAGADPNAKQETFLPTSLNKEFSILHCAVYGSSTEIVEYLLDNGADIDLACQNHMHTLPQYTAIYADSLDTLKVIYQRSNKSQLIDEHGNTLLHYAVASDEDRSPQLELLVELGVDVNQQNEKGETPIASFANNSVWIPSNEKGPHLSNLKKIIQLGGDPNSKTLEEPSGFFKTPSQTPLGLLARGQLDEETTLEAAKLLISAGAEVNAVDSSGDTPLNTAVGKDNGLVKYLLECGADPNYSASLYSNTPFAHAVVSPFSNETVDGYIELIEMFLNAGCDPRAEVFERNESCSAAELIIKRLEKRSFDLQNLEAGSPIRGLLRA